MTDHPPKKKLGFRKGWPLVSVKSDSLRLRASNLAQSNCTKLKEETVIKSFAKLTADDFAMSACSLTSASTP